MARATRVVVDLGAGDGRAVGVRARLEPGALVIGIDANAAAMAEASRRAARSTARGGLPNALFVVAAAERPPAELLGVAEELTMLFPWGSLLRGALAVDDEAAAGIASLLRPGASAAAFVSMAPRDGLSLASLDEPGAAEALAGRWACHGLRLESLRPATAAEVRATGSTWARRLKAGEPAGRPAWRFILHRTGDGDIRSQDMPRMGR
jgi:16S rRNA (adenine(1408)-N(1))-methyltransferase